LPRTRKVLAQFHLCGWKSSKKGIGKLAFISSADFGLTAIKEVKSSRPIDG